MGTQRSETELYYPPPESEGGWRWIKKPQEVREIAGMDPKKLDLVRQMHEFRYGGNSWSIVVIRHGYLVKDVTVNVEEQDPWEIVSKITDGDGADVFIECSGSPKAVRTGFRLVRRGGRYTEIGLTRQSFELDFDAVAFKEITIRGSIGQKWTSWNRALKLLSRGLVETDHLVSDIFPLTEWKRGFTKMERKEGVKVILTPID